MWPPSVLTSQVIVGGGVPVVVTLNVTLDPGATVVPVGTVVATGAVCTDSFALSLLATLAAFLNTARYRWPSSDAVTPITDQRRRGSSTVNVQPGGAAVR